MMEWATYIILIVFIFFLIRNSTLTTSALSSEWIQGIESKLDLLSNQVLNQRAISRLAPPLQNVITCEFNLNPTFFDRTPNLTDDEKKLIRHALNQSNNFKLAIETWKGQQEFVRLNNEKKGLGDFREYQASYISERPKTLWEVRFPKTGDRRVDGPFGDGRLRLQLCTQIDKVRHFLLHLVLSGGRFEPREFFDDSVLSNRNPDEGVVLFQIPFTHEKLQKFRKRRLSEPPQLHGYECDQWEEGYSWRVELPRLLHP